MMIKNVDISVHKIVLPKFVIREKHEEEDIIELMLSIKERGLLYPLLVRPLKLGFFELMGGYKRYLALVRLGFDKVPCRIIECDDSEAIEVALVDNIQRKNLSDYDIAKTLKYLLENFPKRYSTQKVLAKNFGKKESWISEHLAILELEKILPSEFTRKIGHKVAADIRATPKDQRDEIISQIHKKGKITRKDIKKIKKTKSQEKFVCSSCDGGTRIVTRNECSQTLNGIIHTSCGYLVLPINNGSSILEAPIAIEIPKPDVDKHDILQLREAIARATQYGDLPKGGTWHGKAPIEYVYSTHMWNREKIILFLDSVRNPMTEAEKIDRSLTSEGFLVVRRIYESPLTSEFCGEVIDALKVTFSERMSSGEAL